MAFQIVNESTLSAIVQNVAGMVAFPIPSDPAGSTDPAVQGLIKDTQVRKWIDLDSPQLPAGLDMLISAGFAIDKDAILNAPIQPNELP